MRSIIFNCPPQAGKDTIADLYVSRHPNSEKKMFKKLLFDVALLISGVSEKDWFSRYEKNKNDSWDKLGGLSQREYLIRISEDWIKPTHGQSYFGIHLANSLTEDRTYIISDGGFDDEIKPLFDVPSNDVLIVQWGRTGCDFSNDSRDWIINYPENTIRISDNNTDIETHYKIVENAIASYFYSLRNTRRTLA